MEVLIWLVLGSAGLFLVLYVLGRIKGEPDLESLSPDGLRMQLWVLERWINKYYKLSNPDATLRAMYEHKRARVEKAKSLLPAAATVQRIQAVAKERGISAEAAGDLLFKEVADRKRKYMETGMAMREAESKALAEVFGF